MADQTQSNNLGQTRIPQLPCLGWKCQWLAKRGFCWDILWNSRDKESHVLNTQGHTETSPNTNTGTSPNIDIACILGLLKRKTTWRDTTQEDSLIHSVRKYVITQMSWMTLRTIFQCMFTVYTNEYCIL